jgi:hypothetical protein
VVSYERGSEGPTNRELAAAASRETTDPVYLVSFHEWDPSVSAFIGGEDAGEVFQALPDTLVAYLGCAIEVSMWRPRPNGWI